MADSREDLANSYNLKLPLANVTEMYLGFTGINTYQCLDLSFKEKFDAIGAIVAVDEEKELTEIADQPVVYTAFKNCVHLTSGSIISAGTKIMTCYGVIVQDSGQTIESNMIKTSHNFFIDGRQKSSLWIFIHESCNGNCELKEGWLKTRQGPQYVCWLAAKTDIKVGDKLTIDFGGFSGQIVTPENCKCGYGTCPSLAPPPSPSPGENEYPCKYPACKEVKTVYKTKVGLAMHEKLVHGQEPDKDVKLREKGKGTIKCTFKVGKQECERTFYEKKYLTRHIKQVHERSQTRTCDKCRHTYLTEANYQAHFANKKGCNRKRKRDEEDEDDEEEAVVEEDDNEEGAGEESTGEEEDAEEEGGEEENDEKEEDEG